MFNVGLICIAGLLSSLQINTNISASFDGEPPYHSPETPTFPPIMEEKQSKYDEETEDCLARLGAGNDFQERFSNRSKFNKSESYF